VAERGEEDPPALVRLRPGDRVGGAERVRPRRLPLDRGSQHKWRAVANKRDDVVEPRAAVEHRRYTAGDRMIGDGHIDVRTRIMAVVVDPLLAEDLEPEAIVPARFGTGRVAEGVRAR